MGDLKPSAGRPKSLEKRKQILASAAELFLSMGFERTSMDAVAQKSNVSKQTVYSHFKNKDALFLAVIEYKCEQHKVDTHHINYIHKHDLADILEEVAIKFIHLLQDPEVISMYTTVIGESNLNNHIAELFFEAGPQKSIDLVSNILQQHTQSRLDKISADKLSLDFFNLLKGDFHMQAILNLPFEKDSKFQQNSANTIVQKTLVLLRSYYLS